MLEHIVDSETLKKEKIYDTGELFYDLQIFKKDDPETIYLIKKLTDYKDMYKIYMEYKIAPIV